MFLEETVLLPNLPLRFSIPLLQHCHLVLQVFYLVVFLS